MSWFPRIRFHGWCSCESDDVTFEGVSVQVRWLGVLFEMAVALRETAHAR